MYEILSSPLLFSRLISAALDRETQFNIQSSLVYMRTVKLRMEFREPFLISNSSWVHYSSVPLIHSPNLSRAQVVLEILTANSNISELNNRNDSLPDSHKHSSYREQCVWMDCGLYLFVCAALCKLCVGLYKADLEMNQNISPVQLVMTCKWQVLTMCI